MRVRALGAIAVTMGVFVIAGCGVRATANIAPAGRAPAPCVTPRLTAPGKTFTITEKDNGKRYCVVAGTKMFVFLHSGFSRTWTRISVSSTVLQPQPSGIFSLARGVTGAYYLAARLGNATLESSRPPCHPAASASEATCGAANLFRVTILVRGRM